MAARKRVEKREKRRKSRPILTVLKVVAALVLVICVALGCYVGYLELNYTRIPDGVVVENEGATPRTAELEVGVRYTALTYNIGFGAYTPDYSFFMETGIMADGTETQGEHSVAVSEESVGMCTAGAITVSLTADGGSPADFMLLQEVDVDSDRSYHTDQRALFEDAFSKYGAWYAENFHSGYLAYPIPECHGRVRSGLLTLGDVSGEAVRHSYPVDESFPWKFADLDRCFSELRVPTSDGHELVIINSHMSAYDEGGVIRTQQMELICGVLAEEYAKGNYVIAGGDFNHALCDSLRLYLSRQRVPDWVASFDEGSLPSGFSVVRPDNLEAVASCRSSDIPYEEGVTYRVTVDGFIVSANVRATATVIDTGYAFSDHNPVLLSFELVG